MAAGCDDHEVTQNERCRSHLHDHSLLNNMQNENVTPEKLVNLDDVEDHTPTAASFYMFPSFLAMTIACLCQTNQITASSL